MVATSKGGGAHDLTIKSVGGKKNNKKQDDKPKKTQKSKNLPSVATSDEDNEDDEDNDGDGLVEEDWKENNANETSRLDTSGDSLNPIQKKKPKPNDETDEVEEELIKDDELLRMAASMLLGEQTNNNAQGEEILLLGDGGGRGGRGGAGGGRVSIDHQKQQRQQKQHQDNIENTLNEIRGNLEGMSLDLLQFHSKINSVEHSLAQIKREQIETTDNLVTMQEGITEIIVLIKGQQTSSPISTSTVPGAPGTSRTTATTTTTATTATTNVTPDPLINFQEAMSKIAKEIKKESTINVFVFSTLTKNEGALKFYEVDGVASPLFFLNSANVTASVNSTYEAFKQKNKLSFETDLDLVNVFKEAMKAQFAEGFATVLGHAKLAIRNALEKVGTFGSHTRTLPSTRNFNMTTSVGKVHVFNISPEYLREINVSNRLMYSTTQACVNPFKGTIVSSTQLPSSSPVEEVDIDALKQDFDYERYFSLHSTSDLANLGIPRVFMNPQSDTNPGFFSAFAFIEILVMLFGAPCAGGENILRFNRQKDNKEPTKKKLTLFKEGNHAGFKPIIPDGFVVSKQQVCLAISLTIDVIVQGNESNEQFKENFGINATRNLLNVKAMIQRNASKLCDLIERKQAVESNGEICAFKIKTPSVATDDGDADDEDNE